MGTLSFLVRLPVDRYERDAFSGFAPGPFNLGTARAMMWLAQLSYEDEAAKQHKILEQWGLTCIASYNRPFPSVLPMPSTGGFVARSRDTVFVVFQGTDPLVLANWVSDFDFLPNKDGIHRGFHQALDVVWQDIAAAFQQTKLVRRLIITGHSLGAALAALCAHRIANELTITAEAIYAFGMPRLGTPAFAAAYNKKLGERTYRLIHGSDVVPTIPPSEFGFCHVGRRISCEAHALFEISGLDTQPSDQPLFINTWLSAAKATLRRYFRRDILPTDPSPIIQASRLLPAGFGDHLPDRYWRALKTQ